MKLHILYFCYKVINFILTNRLFISFIIISGFVFGTDFLFTTQWDRLQEFSPTTIGIDFAPEVWLSLLSLVLGTLIIVISIASQNLPKLVDLYMQDWQSLFYVWFLVLAGIHAVLAKVRVEEDRSFLASAVLNDCLFLPLAIVLVFPYIYYILRCTKPVTVIERIFANHLQQVNLLPNPYVSILLNNPQFKSAYQSRLFASLNQLDNLLSYVTLKEAQAQIIEQITELVDRYITLKPNINPQFFLIGQEVRTDISFRTTIEFEDLERSRIFYEQKCFRLLNNAYTQFIEKHEFDLASLCVSEIYRVGITAISIGDDRLIDTTIVRFNTILRIALKHGTRNNEARNLYNFAFHYGNFISNLVHSHKIEQAKLSFHYLRLYGTEIFKYGKTSPVMYFIVDVFAAEMKKILMLAHELNLDTALQSELLFEMLQVDSLPNFMKDDLDKGQFVDNGVRTLQIGLALFYLKNDRPEFVERIINDIIDDLEYWGKESFCRLIEMTCKHLQLFNHHFWEDTDRGNLNIYYTPYKDYIDQFQDLLISRIRLYADNSLELDRQREELSAKELERILGRFHEQMLRYLHRFSPEK
ncbi:hypothetical protein [Pseudanabaena sp. 'Roaring Creek']|uniref:hypothetical protein n=1 Tax=Pseudanabaena sp. 'Roaring Creek' TaxID=1681830 RepID=UPI0006D7F049|nr:hypothetical protein [Pseudanabaena sp. 'Roaring Creek']